MKQLPTNPSTPFWQDDVRRHVAFLDIMGFKDMIVRKPHSEVKSLLIAMSKLKESLATAALGIERTQHVRSVIFSDSVLFITQNDTVADLLLLIQLLKSFQQTSIQQNTPTKGAISTGFFTANFENSIFFGQPLIDAFNLQSELYYYGVALDNHAEATLADANAQNQSIARVASERLIWLPTPLKSGRVTHCNVRLDELSSVDSAKMFASVSGSTRKYVDNTIEVCRLMRTT